MKDITQKEIFDYVDTLIKKQPNKDRVIGYLEVDLYKALTDPDLFIKKVKERIKK